MERLWEIEVRVWTNFSVMWGNVEDRCRFWMPLTSSPLFSKYDPQQPSPGTSWKTRVLRTYLRPSESVLLGSPGICVFKPSKWLWAHTHIWEPPLRSDHPESPLGVLLWICIYFHFSCRKDSPVVFKGQPDKVPWFFSMCLEGWTGIGEPGSGSFTPLPSPGVFPPWKETNTICFHCFTWQGNSGR